LNNIEYDLELLNSKDEVITNIKHITFQIDDSLDTKEYYKLNCSTIPKGDYYLRVNCQATGNFEFNINDCLYEEDPSLHKDDIIEIILQGNSIPRVYALLQNYPNPFNPITTINYQIPENGLVILRIYDILGNEVRTLVNENKVAGRYEVNFDASSLASGVYLYTLKVNDYADVKKMILMK
jgi:hypothetical protein